MQAKPKDQPKRTQTWSFLTQFSEYPPICGWHCFLHALRTERVYAETHAPLYCIMSPETYATYLSYERMYYKRGASCPQLLALADLSDKSNGRHIYTNLGLFFPVDGQDDVHSICTVQKCAQDAHTKESKERVWSHLIIPVAIIQVFVPIHVLQHAVFLDEHGQTDEYSIRQPHAVYETYQTLCSYSQAKRHIHNTHQHIALCIDNMSVQDYNNVYAYDITPGMTPKAKQRILVDFEDATDTM